MTVNWEAMLAVQRPEMGLSLLKSGSDLVVAGYASVELVDKQGDLITRGALKDAFGGFMKSEKYRNVQLAHSNIQVGEVIDSYVDSNGRMWKSEVDDTVRLLRKSARATCAGFPSVDKHSSVSVRPTTPMENTKKSPKWNSTRLRFARRGLTLKHNSAS